MSENKSSQQRKENLFTLFLSSFCFILFPLFILAFAIGNYLDLQKTNLNNSIIQKVNHNLDKLELYKGNQNYFSNLFSKVLEIADKAKKPEKYLKSQLDLLKKQYPKNSFSFVVWRSNGKIIDKLTDIKKFRYALKKAFEVLKEAQNAILKDDNVEISELPAMKKYKTILKTLMGDLFIPDNLKIPFTKGKEISLIMSDFKGGKEYYWYKFGKKFGLLCFINQKLFKEAAFSKKIVKAINKQSYPYITGLASVEDIENPITAVPTHLLPKLKLAMANFENSSKALYYNEEYIIAIRMLTAEMRSFCIVEKSLVNQDTKTKTPIIVTQFFVLYALILLIAVLYLNKIASFTSIKWKLTALFLYSNLAPILIIISISHDYLENKTTALKNEFNVEANRLITDFDNRFFTQKADLSMQLNRHVEYLDKKLTKTSLSQKDFQDLKDAVGKTKPGESYFVASSGKLVFSFSGLRKSQKTNPDFMVSLGNAVLKYVNLQKVEKKSAGIYSALLSPDSSDFIRLAQKRQKQLIEFGMGRAEKLGYWAIIGDLKKYAASYFLLNLYEPEPTHAEYLDKYFSNLYRNSSGFKPFAISLSGNAKWPSNLKMSDEMKDFLKKVSAQNRLVESAFNIAGEKSAVYGMKGKTIYTTAICLSIPESIITNRINRLRQIIYSGAILSLFFAGFFALIISYQFLIPINKLAEGTAKIGERDFRFRINNPDKDEFGHLSEVFNRVIEGLGELEIAGVVQESLFPENSLNFGDFKVFGKSVVMTSLGGDYYDFISLGENKTGIILGDVAGHGVPAGLLMAMAKAAVLVTSEDEKKDPTLLTKAVHKMFLKIKKRHLKKMMTFQYLTIEAFTGEVKFANAGHCFPIIVRPQKKESEFVEQVAMPLGVSKRSEYPSLDFKIEPGEALLLYTDGIAEAQNEKGEDYGFDRLKNTICSFYDPNPEIFYENLYRNYKNWSPVADDDLTLIVVCRMNQNEK